MLNARWLTTTLFRASRFDPKAYNKPLAASITRLYEAALTNASRADRLNHTLYAAQVAQQMLPAPHGLEDKTSDQSLSDQRADAAIYLLEKNKRVSAPRTH